ncbi:hypothetical protein J2W56_000631 [Nocardia kruczakiae]|uniref:Uncharacterized protein n=1 Tax=Nocardia kruczakiae TaxID=261477 RepID=A0ABU1X8N9_9NOCA|nr:hypothetical protein [Nocardia kruczakiae]MDR7166913.1 hypothetical protein [Nocardia kruczakiae]
MTHSDPVPAVAYLRADLSGSSAHLHELWLGRLAVRLGYRLDEIIRVEWATRMHGIALIIANIEIHRAEAVFVPNVDHLDGHLDRIVSRADVIEQNGETYARWIPITAAIGDVSSLLPTPPHGQRDY